MKTLQFKRFSVFIYAAFILIACQDDAIVEEELIETDFDMIIAIELADEYLSSTAGRDNSERSITVLKYHKDKLYFATNTDDVKGYQELTETSITAIVDPGEFVFWYAGGGVSDLDGIEFDPTSQDDLDEYPEEINADRMWKLQVPMDGDLPMYKYDILYQHKDNDGTPIRLDPKIRVKGDEEE
ncbi:hypothetical protein SAMN05421640_1675 [Ekhidna lutea]|uniref:Uncharacterized protein n=1 Tax=Ekhidna lutea TaxID=447679 RepID=A0A239IHW9_EKHLU|nr:hypothetical protein [Ekhidna lutea]SNS93207.1 hypothetical protein SAMN05421640_1675 [Ekhidna lutea]